MQELAQELDQREFFPHPKAIEPINDTQLGALEGMLGVGAIIVDLYLVDISVGRGILEGDDRCLWTEDGKRITVSTGGGALVATISNHPDPLYTSLKAEKGL